jgi:micrococcal nuclease
LLKYLFLATSFLLLSCSCDTKVKIESTPTKNECALTKTTIPCVKYVDNYDGDTIKIELASEPEMFRIWDVRVYGIDTPEIKGKTECEKKWAQKIKVKVHDMLKAATRIDLLEVEHDKYFRLLAKVRVYTSKTDFYDLSSVVLKIPGVKEYFGDKKTDFVCPLGN